MVYQNTDIEVSSEPRIAVIGVGGAGCNVVSQIYGSLCAVDTIAINTDKKSLHEGTQADKKIYICKEVLKGEGARGDAVLGKRCADIHKEEIRNAIAGHDFAFVVAGLGGGTGTGAASVVVEAAQSQGIMTFAIGIEPFFFEGSRIEVAKAGFRHLQAVCERTVLIQNDKVLQVMPDLTMDKAFRTVNQSIVKYIMDTVAECSNVFSDETMRLRAVKGRELPKNVMPLSTVLSA